MSSVKELDPPFGVYPDGGLSQRVAVRTGRYGFDGRVMRGFCLSGNFAMKAEKNVVFFSEDFAAIVTEKGGDELYKCSFVTSFCHNNHLLANKHLFISLYPARRSLDSLEMGI